MKIISQESSAVRHCRGTLEGVMNGRAVCWSEMAFVTSFNGTGQLDSGCSNLNCAIYEITVLAVSM